MTGLAVIESRYSKALIEIIRLLDNGSSTTPPPVRPPGV